MTNKMQLCRIIYYSLAALHVSSDIFPHHQEHLDCITASVITHVCRCQPSATYVCNTRSCNTVQMLLMMRENIARNMQSSQGIINYPTQLHLVGHFRILHHDAREHKQQKSYFLCNKKTTVKCFKVFYLHSIQRICLDLTDILQNISINCHRV